MFERFSEKIIKVVMLAQEEARRLGHNWVGAEHLLLGLIGEGTTVASKALIECGAVLKACRLETEKILGRGSSSSPKEIPFTPRTKRILELSWDEARSLNHSRIGPEHLLLALIRERGGVAYIVLERLGVNDWKLYGDIRRSLGQDPADMSKLELAESFGETLGPADKALQ